ncbi:uncharacterized protein LOC135463606 isoform X2 [Liolophura sinensis]|uniref:uncharacterized protein LOC135463606 isoform X2 n=1 Tax=Liolophura sinensis TaxID=3198878 RepID=UPI003158BBC0
MDAEVHGRLGRALLSITDNLPMSHELSLQGSALIVTGVAMVIVIIAVVAMCVCNQNSPQLTTISPRKPTIDGLANHAAPAQPVGNHISVSIPGDWPTETGVRTSLTSPSPEAQGEVNKRENGPNGARCSSTLSRQLPDPPVSKEMGAGASAGDVQGTGSNDQRNSNTSHSSHGDAPVDDYDRLHQPKAVFVDDPGYDHVESQRVLASQRATSLRNRENIYATPTGESSDSGSGTVVAATVTSLPVRENIYAVPNGEPSDSGSGMIVGIRENDYTMPSGEEDVNYSTIPSKASRAPSEVYASVDSEYDPYARIDSGNKVVPRLVVAANESRLEGDFSAAASANASPPAVAPSSTENAERSSTVFEDGQMYAVVSRPRTSPQPVSTPTAPALPDRGYEPEEVGSLPGSGSNHQISAQMSDPQSPGDSNVQETTVNKKRRQPSYTEVTARESLASMQQRQQNQVSLASGGGAAAAAPGFETFKDLPENYYARVDGSSGDGAFSAQGAVALDVEGGTNRNSEMYSEINTSGGSYQMIPAPPPVDSLPQLRLRDNQGEAKRRIEESVGPDHNEEGYALVLQSTKRARGKDEKQLLSLTASWSVGENLGVGEARRLTTSQSRVMEHRRSAPLATVESDHDLSIDPGYQMVKDVPEIENESDFDPNYETVEETKKKALNTEAKTVPPQELGNGAAVGQVRPIRLHDYEEVTDVRNRNSQESAYDVKKRVLQNHCYEDITDVKEEQKRQKKREL